MSTPVTQVGEGFSTFRGEAVRTVLDGTIDSVGSASVGLKIHVCTSSQEILDALNIDVSVEASCPWGSFQDRLSYASETSKKTNTATILCVATRETEIRSFAPSNLKQEFQGLDGKQLYTKGGDCFVSTVTMGGQYIASFQFQAMDVTQVETIKNDAQATVGNGTSDVKASLSTAISSARKTARTDSVMNHLLVGMSDVNLPNMDSVVDFALNFGAQTLDKPEIMKFTVQSYGEIGGAPDVTALDTNRRAYADPTTGLGVMRYKLLDAQTSILDAYDAHLTEITTWSTTVDKDPTIVVQPPLIKAADITTPVADYSLLTSDWVGGHGSSGNFADVDLTYVPLHTRVSSISIRGGAAMNALGIAYLVNIPTPTIHDNGWHGGGGGSEFKMNLSEFEIVQRIDIKASNNICKRMYITTDQQTKSYPNTDEGDAPMSWVCDVGKQCLFGFGGSSGALLDGCQVMYLQFHPARWS